MHNQVTTGLTIKLEYLYTGFIFKQVVLVHKVDSCFVTLMTFCLCILYKWRCRRHRHSSCKDKEQLYCSVMSDAMQHARGQNFPRRTNTGQRYYYIESVKPTERHIMSISNHGLPIEKEHIFFDYNGIIFF